MECLPKDSILKFNPTTLEDVRKDFNLHKPGEMEAAVNILQDWVKQQKHFVKKDFSRHYLELTIILNKGSLERAKTRLDRSCTLRTLMPEIFQDYDIRNNYEKDLKGLTALVLPKMTKDHCRIYVLRALPEKYEPDVLMKLIQNGLFLAEYARKHDYALGHHGIFDYREINLMDLYAVLNIQILTKLVTILIEGYGFRIKGINLITESKAADIIVSLIKQVLPAKLGNRVHVHKNLDTIVKMFGKDILPAEFDGNEKSLVQLKEEWLDVLGSREHVEYQREMNAARTDESLRHRDTFNQHYMGMPGTFRTLTVD